MMDAHPGQFSGDIRSSIRFFLLTQAFIGSLTITRDNHDKARINVWVINEHSQLMNNECSLEINVGYLQFDTIADTDIDILQRRSAYNT